MADRIEKTLDETIEEMEDVVESLEEELDDCRLMLSQLRRQRAEAGQAVSTSAAPVHGSYTLAEKTVYEPDNSSAL